MSTWSTWTEIVDGCVRVQIMLSTDEGPMKEFRPYLDVDLDEPNAILLFGELGLALQTLSIARTGTNVVPIRPEGGAA